MEYAYDQMLTALFAEQHRALEAAHNTPQRKRNWKRPVTLIDRLHEIWNDLMPRQYVSFSERTVRAIPRYIKSEPYEGSEMSDGERLVVYMLGQALLLEKGGLLIVDEPELHISRALLARLWDAIEKARPDCSFIYITHDIDFGASRLGARMYAVLGYRPPTYKDIVVRGRKQIIEATLPQWELKTLPTNSDLPSDLLVRIVGSRKPILFVEGRLGGLDQHIYKATYSEFTVVPGGSCREVIQFVRSFKAQAALHWLFCAGIVDLDFRSAEPDGRLEKGLYILPVSEIENLLLVEDVFVALAAALSFQADEATRRFKCLQVEVLEWASRETERMSLKRASDQIWHESSSIGLKAKSVDELTRLYDEKVAKIDPAALYAASRTEYEDIIAKQDFTAVLMTFDSKGGLLNKLARCLGLGGRVELEALAARLLTQGGGRRLIAALQSRLPTIKSQEGDAA